MHNTFRNDKICQCLYKEMVSRDKQQALKLKCHKILNKIP